MNAIRDKLNQIARLALELGLTKTDLYGIGDTTGLQTWGFKYAKYSRSAAVMSIMIERTIHMVSAINNTAEGIELMQIFLKHQGLVGEAIGKCTEYSIATADNTVVINHKLADSLDPNSALPTMISVSVATLSPVVEYLLATLSSTKWIDRSFQAMLSAYSSYCNAFMEHGIYNKMPIADIVNTDIKATLRLSIWNANRACNTGLSDQPQHIQYHNFISMLTKYAWVVEQTGYGSLTIHHNTTTSAPPLRWVIMPKDIGYDIDELKVGGVL